MGFLLQSGRLYTSPPPPNRKKCNLHKFLEGPMTPIRHSKIAVHNHHPSSFGPHCLRRKSCQRLGFWLNLVHMFHTESTETLMADPATPERYRASSSAVRVGGGSNALKRTVCPALLECKNYKYCSKCSKMLKNAELCLI